MAFVADRDAAVAAEPGDGAFDLPAVSAEVFAGVDAAAGDAGGDAALAQPGAVGLVVVRLVGAELGGDSRPGPRRDRTAGMPSTSGRRALLSWVCAAVTSTTRGRPPASDRTWIFEPAPQPGRGPRLEPAVPSGLGHSERLRQMPPGTTRGQHEHDRGEHRPVIDRVVPPPCGPEQNRGCRRRSKTGQ